MKTSVVTAAVLALCCVPPAIAQPAADEPWFTVVSRHFVVHTNATPERGAEIATGLERFRAVFAQLSPELELSSPAPTKILAFRDAESYLPYKTRAERGVLGQFLSHPDGNYITLDAGSSLVGSFTVIQHEYVHFFVRHNFPGVPRWFNEGLAEYYSTFATDGERAYVGQPVERHLSWLRRSGDVRLGDVLSGGAVAGGHGEGRQAGRFYATSWALVHHLLSGETRQLDRAADYFLRLRAGEDPGEAFEEAFDLRLRQLEEKLVAYVRSEELPQAAIPLASLPAPDVEAWVMRPEDVLYHLGDLLAHMQRASDAERHFQLALDHAGDHAGAHAGLAVVRDLQSRFEEAELLYLDAARLGSDDPLTFLHYGRHLVMRARAAGRRPGRVELARRAQEQLRSAVERDAEYGEAWALLGIAYLFADDRSNDGVRALERAIHLLPGRPGLVFDLVRTHLHQGRLDLAESLVEEELAPRATAEMTAKAREAVQRARLLAAAEAAFRQGDPETGLEYYDRAIAVTSDDGQRQQMEQKLLELQEQFR